MSLPPYTFVPGHWPHPVRDPDGHSYGRGELVCEPLDPEGEAWREHATWCRAVELFDHGYYWEAHEGFEAVWVAAGREGPVACLAQGLIKLAAAAIKLRQGNAGSGAKLAAQAGDLFEALEATPSAGLRPADLRLRASEVGGCEVAEFSPDRPVERVVAPLSVLGGR